MPATAAGEESRKTARRQLRQVLTVLAVLDTSVLVYVIGLALAWAHWHFPVPELVGLLVGGIGAILCTRLWLAARLRRRSGNLY